MKKLYATAEFFKKEEIADVSDKKTLLSKTEFLFARILCLISILLLFSIGSHANTYYSIASGNWNTNTTWSLSSGGSEVGPGIFPIAGDDVIIEGGFTVTLPVDATCANIQVGSSGTGTLAFGSASSLTLTTSGNVTVNSGSGIMSNTSGSQIHNFNIAGNINCTGTWDMYGIYTIDDINVTLNGATQTITGNGTYSWNTLTINNGSTTTASSTGSQTIQADLTISGTLNFGTTTFNRPVPGGTLTVNGKMILGSNTGGQTGSNFPTNFSTITLTGGTVEYNYAGAQTVYDAPDYTNVTLSESGEKTIANAKVNGILSMEGTATATGVPTYGSAATLQYKGISSITTSNNEFPANFAGSGGIIIDQGTGNTVTLNENKTGIAGNLNIKTGAFNLAEFTANRATEGGTLTIASGALIKIAGTNTFPSNYTTHSIDCTSTTEYSGTNQTIANLNSSQNYGNLILSGSGSKTLQTGTTTICNNFTITGTANTTGITGLTIGGNVLIDATASFTAGAFEHSVGGNWTTTGTFNATGSTINFNSSSTAQNIGASNFNNITFSNAGSKTATGILTISGDVVVNSNFIAGNYSHSVAGNWTTTGTFNATGSTINFNSSSTAQNIGASDFNNITFSNAGSKTATGILTIAGDVLVNSNFNAGNYSHSVAGNWTNNGTFSAATSTITFIPVTLKTIGGSNPTIFNNATLNGSGGIALGANTLISETLTLTAGLLNIGSYNLTTNAINGGDATSYIKTSGAGRLKRTISAGGTTYLFPVGNSAYNPLSLSSNAQGLGNTDVYSIRVEDGDLFNTNIDSKTVNRKWYISSASTGVPSLSISGLFRSNEESSSFPTPYSAKIAYYNGTAWYYTAATLDGSDPYTMTASNITLDMTSTSGYIALGCDDAFNASSLAVTIQPTTPIKGLSNTIATIQAQNSSGVPTIVSQDTYFNLTSNKSFTRSGGLTGLLLASNTYQTILNNLQFLSSTGSSEPYAVTANVTATRTSGDTLTAGKSANFAIKNGNIYQPSTSGNWNSAQWQVSTDGGSTWANTTLPTNNIFAESDIIQIPAGTTLVADTSSTFYSMLIYGTLDISATDSLTLNHTTGDLSDYNIKVYGTLKNSGGTIINTNSSYTPIDFYGGTYWHATNGDSIPIATWNSLNATLSTCKITGISSTALSAGLGQSFQNFTWDNSAQSVIQNLQSDLSVSGTLTLTNGIITTGSNHIILQATASTTSSNNSHIDGNMRIIVPETSSPTVLFPIGDSANYTPISIDFTGTISGSGYLDASNVVGQPPLVSGLSQSKYINRLWTITNNNVSGFTSYSPTFTFVDGDKIGSITTSALTIRKLTNSVWSSTTDGAKTSNSTQCSGLTSFSTFAIGEDDCTSTNYIWIGNTNTDWNNASNWCSNQVPSSTTDVTISTGAANQPTIGSAGGYCKNLSIESGATLTIAGADTLHITENWINNGTFICNSGTVSFTGSSAQSISGTTTYYNLNINNSTGVTATSNITVNGNLHLQTANASTLNGALDMGSDTLNMGPDATNTGSSDVTGTITRTDSFTTNKTYTFGNPNTSIYFNTVSGTQSFPSSISIKVSIGNTIDWGATTPANTVKRQYEMSYTGTASGNSAVFKGSYLDNELASGTVESTLSIWTHVPSTEVSTETGKSTYDITENYISLDYINFGALPTLQDFAFAPTTSTSYTWNGAVSTDWNTYSNWTPYGVPGSAYDVIIPDSSTTSFDPILPIGASAKTLIIKSGGLLNTISSATLTLSGNGDVWTTEPASTGHAAGFFSGGNSTVTISNTSDFSIINGITDFYNLTVLDGAKLRMAADSHTGIDGALSLSTTGLLDARTNSNTIEYKGADQTIVNPNHTSQGYSNLTINSSISGITTWPATLNIGGNFTNNKSALSISGNVVFDGISASSQSIGGSEPTTFENISITNITDTISALATISVNNTINIASGAILDMHNNTLEGSITSITGTGTLLTQNTSLVPLSSGKTWSFLVKYNATATQTIVAGTYTNITINNPSGATIAAGLTINGILNLQSENPSSTQGAISTGADTISMGANATTTGIGDVTGNIKRQHSFTTNQSYSFGNQYTTLTFLGISGTTKPTWVNCKVSIGAAPLWKTGGVERTYTFTQSATGNDSISTSLHYLDSELNANNESKITIWDHHSDETIVEHVKTNYNTTNNWVSLSGRGINYLTATGKEWSLSEANVNKNTWLGTAPEPTRWDLGTNWSKAHYPGDPGYLTDSVLIPAGAPNYPTLTLDVEMTTLEIESGALLTAGSSNVTISGHTGAWINHGSFTSSTGSVIFSHGNAAHIVSVAGENNNFYNLTLNTNTILETATDCNIKIAGTITSDSPGLMHFTTNTNTFEFNGTNQTLPAPTNGFYNIIISGTGTKTFPGTLNITGDLTNNGTVDTGTGTVIMNNQGRPQNIGGSTSTAFYNLTIDNTNQIVTSSTDFNVSNTFTVNGNTTMDMTTTALGGAFTTTSGTGTLKTQSVSATSLPSGKTWTFNVAYNNTSTAQTVPAGTYTSLQVSNPASVTASGTLDCTGLMIDNGTTLDMNTYALTGGTTISSAGTLKTQNTSTTAIPSGKTWGGVVIFNGSETQSLPANSIFNHLTIDNTTGVNVNDSATVNGTLSINSGKNLTISTGAKMVANQVANNAGVSGLVIKANSIDPNGTLIFHNAPSSPVLGTVEMYSKAAATNQNPYSNYKWEFFGIPLQSVTADPTFYGSYVRKHNEAGTTSATRWINQTNSSVLTPVTGYEITQPIAKTITFQGQLVNSDISTPLSYTETSQYPGQNILSNPYTAAINIKEISFGNDLDKVVYFYNTGSKTDWSTQTGIDLSPGQYIAIPQNEAGINLPSQIPSMQGFLVTFTGTTHASNTFGVTYNSAVARNIEKQRVRAENKTTAEKVYTRINIAGKIYSDKMWLFSEPSCSHGYDNGWDGTKFLGTSVAPQLWAMESNGDYQVNAVDDINNTELGFIKGVDTTYTMTFTHSNTSSKYSNIYLLDQVTNTTTNITQSGSVYTFTVTSASAQLNRFKIITNSETATNTKEATSKQLRVYNSQQNIYVNNLYDCSGEMMLYDATGRAIQTCRINSNGLTTIPTNLQTGTYVVKISTAKENLSKQIIIQ